MSGCFRDNKLPIPLHQSCHFCHSCRKGLPFLPSLPSFLSFPSLLSFPIKGLIPAPQELKHTAESLQSWSFWGFLGSLQLSGNQEKPKALSQELCAGSVLSIGVESLCGGKRLMCHRAHQKRSGQKWGCGETTEHLPEGKGGGSWCRQSPGTAMEGCMYLCCGHDCCRGADLSCVMRPWGHSEQ